MSMRTDDFDYNLPEELIAQAPVEPRDSCRLLVVDRKGSEAGAPLEHGGTASSATSSTTSNRVTCSSSTRRA